MMRYRALLAFLSLSIVVGACGDDDAEELCARFGLVPDYERMACRCPDGTTTRPDGYGCDLPDGGVLPFPDASLPDAGFDSGGTEDSGIDACALMRFFEDADEDGFGDPGSSRESCEAPTGYVANSDDCDDDCGTCRPGGVEVCDGRDNDCNGLDDDGVQTTYHRDADEDGFGDPSIAMSACEAPTGYVEDGTDCNDTCFACNPAGTEVCDGTFDENCRDGVDEGCDCTTGSSRACPGGTNEGECVAGTQSCAAGVWGACLDQVGPVAESCNARDDDCNGTEDDGLAGCAWECAEGACDDVVEVDSNGQGTCVVRASGRVACWGRNSTGRVPGVADEFVLTPRTVGISGATQVTVGEFHACARLADGTVSCWGSSTAGKLGRDTAGVSPAAPGLVTGLTDVVEVRAGSFHTCARRGDGSVWCWGSNNFGELGTGSVSSGGRVMAAPVPGLTNVIGMDCGGYRSCALRAGGEVRCWGNNETSPTVVAGLTATSISVGTDHHCAIRTTGQAVCWGPGADAEAGIGSDTGQTIPAANVLGITAGQIVQLVAGGGISCALLATGRVQCWGSNVGDGTSLTRNAPAFVDVPSGSGFVGDRCVVLNGLPRCWRSYSGDGSPSAPLSPVAALPPM